MASDQTPPQNRLIVTIGLLAVFTLIAVKFIIGSYYIDMTEGTARAQSEVDEKSEYSRSAQLRALRAEQNKALAQSPVPIDVAMKNLATSGRDNAPPVISPQQSDDTSALVGWGKAPHDAKPFTPPPPPIVNFASGDGGVMDGGMLADGGHAATAADAGHVAAITDAGPRTAPPPPAADAGH